MRLSVSCRVAVGCDEGRCPGVLFIVEVFTVIKVIVSDPREVPLSEIYTEVVLDTDTEFYK